MKDNTVLALLGGLIIVAGLLTANWFDGKPYRDYIKNPKAELHCHFIDGWREVHRHMVSDYFEGTWYFTNGSASRCEVR